MIEYHNFDANKCVILTGTSSIPLKETLIVENSDIQALGASIFSAVIARYPSSESADAKSWIGLLLKQLAISGGSKGLVLITTSQIREYLSSLLSKISNKSDIPKVADLAIYLSQQGVVDTYKLVPESISRLDDKSLEVREANLGVISRLEGIGDETISEFVRSSYDWNLRSVYLERKRWTSLSALLSTLMYVLPVSLIASLSVLTTEFEILLSSLIYLTVFGMVVFFFIICVQRATECELKLCTRLSIPNEFLRERKELRKQVQDHYIQLLECRHEKWETILTMLLRLFITITVPSLIAILLGKLPIEATSYGLIGLTAVFLILSSIAYRKMYGIEKDLIDQQKALRKYYTSSHA